jgi:hypothetical protein
VVEKKKINTNGSGVSKKISETQTSTKKILKPKSSLVNQVLRRWWYALDEWPPKNYNYE